MKLTSEAEPQGSAFASPRLRETDAPPKKTTTKKSTAKKTALKKTAPVDPLDELRAEYRLGHTADALIATRAGKLQPGLNDPVDLGGIVAWLSDGPFELDWLMALLRDIAPPKETMERESARENLMAALAGKVKSPARIADAWLSKQHAEAVEYRDGAERLRDPEPWDEAPDAVGMLGELEAVLRRFVFITKEETYPLLAVWALYTWVFPSFDFTPYIHVTSPEPESGKSRLEEVLGPHCRRFLSAGGVTPAVVFRLVDEFHPTIFLDELDTVFGKGGNEELRSVLNLGHQRGKPVWRNVPTPEGGYVPTPFDPYCPKMLAGIGSVPRTIATRSVPAQMLKKLPGEQAERFPRRVRRQVEADAMVWGRKAVRWALDHGEALADADPDIPDGLGDRATDMLEPLFAVADAAGGEWPKRVRESAVALLHSRPGHADDDVNSMLLEDIATYCFGDDESPHDPPAFIPTAKLLSFLNAQEDRPWADWRVGTERGMTAHSLARELKLYGVKPYQPRSGTYRNMRGYDFEPHLADALRRYGSVHGSVDGSHRGLSDLWPELDDDGSLQSEPADEVNR
jgi:hypothetical protein